MKIIAFVLSASVLFAQAEKPKDWIEKSNHYTNLLLDVGKKYSPEEASSQGLAEFDSKISVPTLANSEAERKETEAVLITLKAAAKTETDKNVSEDLSILIKTTEQQLLSEDYSRENLVPAMNPSRTVYQGLRPLLDDQTADSRRPAAVVRLKE